MKFKLNIKRFLPNSLGFIAPIFGLIAVFGIVYFMYWIFKTTSYWFFYEAMVQDTIREMVQAGALK